jgi:hypothetical protein
VNCDDVDMPVQTLRFIVDGVVRKVVSGPGTFDLQADVPISGLTPGVHTLILQADTLNSTPSETELTFSIEQGEPSLALQREIERVENHLVISLTVTNEGTLPTELDRIEDNVTGLHPVNADSDDSHNYSVRTSASYFHNGVTRRNHVEIDLNSPGGNTVTLEPGASTTVSYVVIPILHEDPVTVGVGDLPVKLIHWRPGLGFVEERILRRAGAVSDPGSFLLDPISLDQAVSSAEFKADYIIVTNPWRLFSHYGIESRYWVDQVLASMAELAYLKNGVIGYLNSHDTHVLDDLVEPGGDWAREMNSLFRHKDTGYLLIVGETEIIPSWYVGESHFVTYPGIPDHVHQSDLWYANTAGNTARPELVVGRIIGDSAVQLYRPLEASVNNAKGVAGYDFAASTALLISGTGDGTDSNFKPTVNWLYGELSAWMAPTRVHWSEIEGGHDGYFEAVRSRAAYKDLIYYRDHGNVDQWGKGLFTSDVSSLYFGSRSPFAFSLSCKAGNYEAGNDYNIAEAFLWQGAAVYVGSTEESERETNDHATWDFFRYRWELDESIGQVLNQTKRAIWGNDQLFDHRKLWAFEYNLYGDPKFGRVAEPTSRRPEETPEWTLEPRLDLARGPVSVSALEINIPDLEIYPVGEVDHVKIPNGGLLLDPGTYEIPLYAVSIELPPGERVQDVILAERSGLVVTTGLSIPIVVGGADLEDCDACRTAAASMGEWFPDLADTHWWEVEDRPEGGSTLEVSLLPFYYNTESADALFYQDYVLLLETVSSDVEILSLETDAKVYRQGNPVTVDVWLENSGPATDLIAQATLLTRAKGVVIDGLPLLTLHQAAGTASFAMEWDTTDAPTGDYTILIEILDTAGNLLDSLTEDFALGVAGAEVTAFSANQTEFTPGEALTLTMSVSNTGSISLTGEAVVRIQTGPEITATVVLTQPIAGLAPGESVNLDHLWDTTGTNLADYVAVAYLKYRSQATDALALTLHGGRRVYLPLVLRQ